MTRALLLFALLAVAATTASGETAAPLPPAEQGSLDAFAAVHAECAAWSDGCVVCRRVGKAMDQAVFACSTPGIACTPSSLACREPAQPAPAAKP